MADEENHTQSQMTQKELADGEKERGNTLLRKGDVKGAIVAYSGAIKIFPSNHIYYSNRSAAHLQDGQYDNALQDALKCIEIDATWAKGYSRAAAALNRLERYSECIIKARKGLEYAPGNVGLVDAISRANRALIVQKLKGKWHGVVDAALGVYARA